MFENGRQSKNTIMHRLTKKSDNGAFKSSSKETGAANRISECRHKLYKL